jgi:hypothetical protein
MAYRHLPPQHLPREFKKNPVKPHTKQLVSGFRIKPGAYHTENINANHPNVILSMTIYVHHSAKALYLLITYPEVCNLQPE